MADQKPLMHHQQNRTEPMGFIEICEDLFQMVYGDAHYNEGEVPFALGVVHDRIVEARELRSERDKLAKENADLKVMVDWLAKYLSPEGQKLLALIAKHGPLLKQVLEEKSAPGC